MRYYKRSHVHYSKSAMKIIALVFMLVGVTFLAVGIGFAISSKTDVLLKSML